MIVAGKIPNENGLGRLGLTAAWGHRLAEAGLADAALQPFEPDSRRLAAMPPEALESAGCSASSGEMNLFDPPSRRLLQAVPLALCPVALLTPMPGAAVPDTFRARIEALASMETLNAEILSSRSATKTLEQWCAVHGMAPGAKIKADLVRDVQKAASDDQRTRLAVGPRDQVTYRRVRLTCGDHVLSEADNWYVPGRLTPEMNHLLETTDTPFGKVVAALKPTRETFAVDVLWLPLPDGWEVAPAPADRPADALTMPPILFEHRAVLYDAEHRPFSEVDEHYTREVLAFGRGG